MFTGPWAAGESQRFPDTFFYAPGVLLIDSIVHADRPAHVSGGNFEILT
jgi:hypothetical protein